MERRKIAARNLALSLAWPLATMTVESLRVKGAPPSTLREAGSGTKDGTAPVVGSGVRGL